MGSGDAKSHENSVGMSLSRSEGAHCNGSVSLQAREPFGNLWILLNKQLRSVGRDEVAHRSHQ